jgi:hypothetical protein
MEETSTDQSDGPGDDRVRARDRGDRRPGHPGRILDGFALRATAASVILVSVVFLALFLWYSVYVLFLFFAGVLVAIMLRALAEVVHHFTRLSHRWSLAIVLVVLVGLFAGLWFLAVPSLAKQASLLAEQLPRAWQTFQEKVRGSPVGSLVMGVTGGGGGATGTTQPATQPAPPPSFLGGGTGGGGAGQFAAGRRRRPARHLLHRAVPGVRPKDVRPRHDSPRPARLPPARR